MLKNHSRLEFADYKNRCTFVAESDVLSTDRPLIDKDGRVKKESKMKKEMKCMNYTRPMLDVYELEVESGFGASGGAGSGGYNPWSVEAAEAAPTNVNGENY